MYDPTVPLLEHMTAQLPHLRRSERLVADLVAENPSMVVGSSMARVAEAAGVSEPTVMRFCTSLGFEGFQQFKMVLAQSLALGLPATLSTITAQDSVAEVATKVLDHTISSLDRARRNLDHERVEAAVQAVLGCSQLLFVGLGASGVIASDAEQKSVLFGVPCSAPTDSHQQFMAATVAPAGTVVVAISNTGSTRSVVQVAAAAQENGAVVVAITGEEDSPLARAADITIVVKTFEDTDSYTPTGSRIAGLAVIDILAVAVSLRRGPSHASRLAAMKERLATFRRHQ